MSTRALTPGAFLRAAAKKSFGGAFLVHGHDEYIKTETVRLAVLAFMPAPERSLGVTHLIGSQTDTQEILASAQAIPMLGTRIAVVVHDAHRLASAHKARLPDAIGQVSSPALLIFVGPDEPDRRTRFYKWFFEEERAVACEPLTLKQAEAFALRRCEEAGKEISETALGRLLAHTGSDAGTIARETEKLALYVGQRDRIEDGDVYTVAGHTVETSPEELVDAILRRHAPGALHAARRLMLAGMDPVSLTGRLAMQFFDLHRAALSDIRHPGQLAGHLRLPAARARQLSEWLRLTTPEMIDRSLGHLADAEALARSGRADAPAVVDGLILSLISAPPGRERGHRT